VNEIAAPRSTRWKAPPEWTLLDMLLIVGISVLATIALSAVLGIGLRVLGPGDAREMIRDYPVVASAVAGAAIYGAFLLVTYFRVVRRTAAGWSGLGFRAPPLLPMVLSPLLVLGQLIAVAITQQIVISIIGEFENPQIEALSAGQGFTWLNFILMLLLAGVIAPVVEEVLFRGLLYRWLRFRLPLLMAVLLSAVIFAAAHVILPLMPVLFVVGVLLALAYEFSGSLWLPILLHAMQNSLAVSLIFFALAVDLPLTQ